MLFPIYEQNIRVGSAHCRIVQLYLWIFNGLTAVKTFGLVYMFSVLWKMLQL